MVDELRDPDLDSAGEASDPLSPEGTRLQELEAMLERVSEQASRAFALLDAGQVDAAKAQLGCLLDAERAEAARAALESPVPEPAEESPDWDPGETISPINPIDPLYAIEGDQRVEPSWDPPPPPRGLDFAAQLSDDELDRAFESAESDPEQMHDANRVAEQVLAQTELDPAAEDSFATDRNPLFATETMAELLEGQGHTGRAHAIREALHVEPRETDEAGGLAGWDSCDAYAETWPGEGFESAQPVAAPVSVAEAEGVDAVSGPIAQRLATLERWLENVRRDVA